jgi:hypothetical protein
VRRIRVLVHCFLGPILFCEKKLPEGGSRAVEARHSLARWHCFSPREMWPACGCLCLLDRVRARLYRPATRTACRPRLAEELKTTVLLYEIRKPGMVTPHAAVQTEQMCTNIFIPVVGCSLPPKDTPFQLVRCHPLNIISWVYVRRSFID